MCGGLLAGNVRAVRRLENLLTRARGIDPRAVDAVVAVALVAGAVALGAAGEHHGPLTLLAAAATCATVAWRRRAPAAMTAVAVVSITVSGVSSHGGGEQRERAVMLSGCGHSDPTSDQRQGDDDVH